jgi:hypothetical protein
MRPPAHIKDAQKFVDCLTTLSWFISSLGERALPFFKLLRKSGPFIWIDEAKEVFQELKWYLTSSPVMVAPKPGEPLLLFITVTAEAVSMVLIVERSEPPQPQMTKETSANGSGSQDLELAGSPEVGVATGFQLPETSLASERQVGPDNATRS